MKADFIQDIELAERRLDQARYAEALALFRRVERRVPPQGRVRWLCGSAHALRMLGEYSRAFVLFSKATRLSRLQKDWQSRADALTGLAMCLRAMEKYRQSYSLLMKIRTVYLRHKDTEGLKAIDWFLGGTLRLLGRLPESIRSFQNSLCLARNSGDISGQAYALCGLGGVYRVSGKPDASFTCYRQAHSFFKKLGDPFGLAYAACGMGNALRILRDWDASQRWTRLSIRHYHALNDRVNVGYTYFTETMVLVHKKKLGKAEKVLKEMDRFFQSARDRRGQIYAMLARASLLWASGKIKPAANLFTLAFRRASLMNLPLEKCYARSGCQKLEVGTLPEALLKEYREMGCDPSFLAVPGSLLLNFF